MNFTLVFDALEAVTLTPSSALLWRRLSSLIDELAGDARAALVHRVAALTLAPAEAQWLRCSALAYLTRDPVWFVRQAALVDESTAPDAVMTLLTLLWHHGLVRTPGHRALAQLLQDVDVQRLQALVAARIQSTGDAGTDASSMGTRMRVALYTPEIGDPLHGGTSLALNVLSLLAGQDVDVRAFTTKEASIPAVATYHGGTEGPTPVPVLPASLTLHTQRSIDLTLPNTDLSVRQRFNDVFESINHYDPDVVLFVGFMSPMVYRLHARYAVVGLSVHAMPPAVPVDVWLSAEPDDNTVRWSGLPVPQPVSFPFRFWPAEPFAKIPRASLGVAEDAVVLITAGFRLNTEITAPWSTRMWDFVDTHFDTHWVLMGVPTGESLPGLRSHPRIHLLPPHTVLQAWLALADIYVNPPRIGGGGSVAMAMEQGLPVASLAGGDGGDKLGAFALASDDGYFDQLDAWVRDAAERTRVGKALQARFRARLDISSDAAAAALMQACHLAITAFKQRQEDDRA